MCVRENLRDSQRPVADAVLGLGVFSEAYTRHGVEARAVSALHSDLLGRRRGALLSNWRALHEALGLTPVEPPSDRALRGTIENEVLRELARQLIRRRDIHSAPRAQSRHIGIRKFYSEHTDATTWPSHRHWWHSDGRHLSHKGHPAPRDFHQ